MLSEIVLPYLREVFEKASELDVPVKSVLAPQGFSSDISREPLPPGGIGVPGRGRGRLPRLPMCL